MSRAVVLFTRDLRVRDHAPLAAAVREHSEVIPAFVLDRTLLARSCGAPNRVAFLLDCLQDLRESLSRRGAALIARRGEVMQETLKLAHRWDAHAIYMSADHTPYAHQRHALLQAACERARIELRTFDGVNVVAPGELTPTGGDHYRVFTPYWRQWRQEAAHALVRAPATDLRARRVQGHTAAEALEPHARTRLAGPRARR